MDTLDWVIFYIGCAVIVVSLCSIAFVIGQAIGRWLTRREWM